MIGLEEGSEFVDPSCCALREARGWVEPTFYVLYEVGGWLHSFDLPLMKDPSGHILCCVFDE